MNKRDNQFFILIIVLFALSLWIVVPIKHPMVLGRDLELKKGLDLQGGVQVLLEADAPPGETITLENMRNTKTIIDNRVNGMGVTEPVVQLEGSSRIVVELPGVKNVQDAISTLKGTGQLEFVEIGDSQPPVSEGQYIRTSRGDPHPMAGVPADALPGKDAPVYKTILTGKSLKSAKVSFEPTTGKPQISFTLGKDGAKIFAKYTASHVGKILAITLDKKVLSAPRINSAIPDGQGVITGNFTAASARSLAVQMSYGALPVPLKVVNTRIVGPSLGQQAVRNSLNAGLIGLLIVFLFMLLYYRLPGLLADVALILYVLLNLSIYKLVPITLTLPGIAGFLLSTGIAVDANILIFERMKEEIRRGKPLRVAIEAGFSRAWTSIRDSNLSTLISVLILFQFGRTFGASTVKGFAINLGLGVILSMFTAVSVTRVLVHMAFTHLSEDAKYNHWILDVMTPENIKARLSVLFNIVGKRWYYFGLSSLVIVPGIIAMIYLTITTGTPIKPAIDFTGGSLWEIKMGQVVQPDDIRQLFSQHGLNDVVVQTAGNKDVLIRFRNVDDKQKAALTKALEAKYPQMQEVEFRSVGPAVGHEVTQAAVLAVIIASLAILAFIVFAFRNVPNPIRYGTSAIIAMIHDILVTIGVFSIISIFLGWRANALFLTALLTIIGFSVQDTIVVFDRIRENTPKYRGEDFPTIANRSLLETVHRSLATQLNAFFIVSAIFLFGGESIHEFITVMMVGLISGTYSSIFNAVPILVAWEQGDLKRIFGRKKKAAAA